MARDAVARYLAAAGRGPGGQTPAGDARPGAFGERRGVFVTILTYPDGDLRGCIGFPMPVLPLGEAIVRAAVSAAVDDPRFPPVTSRELGTLSFEVSLLTRPERIAGDRLAAVRVGEDGLIVSGHGQSGLLLPQVAAEQGWDARTFLRETCRKAGLPLGAWEDPEVEVSRFQAEIHHEVLPGGPVVTTSRRPGPGA